jgi:hypothetical protein
MEPGEGEEATAKKRKRGMKAKAAIAAIRGALAITGASYAEEPLAGIGVQIAIKHNALTVIHVVPDTPASKAGLSEGLLIQRIDGTETAGKDLKECAAMLRGQAGTKVKLELVDTAQNKTTAVELVREELKNTPLSAAQVETLALQLANERADTLFHRRPFQDSQPAQFAAGRWIWTDSRGLGLLDFRARVELAVDGSTNSVDVQLFDDALRRPSKSVTKTER